MGGHDARHSGRQTFTPAQGGSPGTSKWIFDTGHPTLRLQACAAIDGQKRIYFTGDDVYATNVPLFAIQEVNGQPVLLWSYSRDPDDTLVGNSMSHPALGVIGPAQPPPPGGAGPEPADYGVFWGDNNGILRCVRQDGTFVWNSVPLLGAIAGGPVIASNGRVYVTTNLAGGMGKLCAFDTRSTGYNVTPIWTFQFPEGQYGAPAVREDDQGVHLIFASTGSSQDAILYNILDTGPTPQQYWSHDMTEVAPKPIVTWPTIGDDGTIYIGTYYTYLGTGSNYIAAYKQDGTAKWTSLTGSHISEAQAMNHMPPIPAGPFGAIEGSPCLGPSGTVFFGAQHIGSGYWSNKSVFMRVTDQGSSAIAEVLASISGSPTNFDPIPSLGIKTTDGTPYIVFASENGDVYLANPATGAVPVPWPYHIPSFDGHPDVVIMKDGTVLMGGGHGILYAIWGPN